MSEIHNDKVKPGTIVQEIQAGYMFGERLLRPAMVVVSKGKEKKVTKNGSKVEKPNSEDKKK